MLQTILVAVAWPYANTPLHLGQIAGAYLPADIFARYHRMAVNRGLTVSGPASHGPPATHAADWGRSAPEQVRDKSQIRWASILLAPGSRLAPGAPWLQNENRLAPRPSQAASLASAFPVPKVNIRHLLNESGLGRGSAPHIQQYYIPHDAITQAPNQATWLSRILKLHGNFDVGTPSKA